MVVLEGLRRSSGANVSLLEKGYKRLYTGVTARLRERGREHQRTVHPGSFMARYNVVQLVWLEERRSVVTANPREKQIEGWLWVKKLHSIVAGIRIGGS